MFPVDDAATFVVVVVSVPEPSVARGMKPAICADQGAEVNVELQFDTVADVSLSVAVRTPIRFP